MTPEQEANFQKWMAALRSGKFKQGFRRFISPDGSKCAIGVAYSLDTGLSEMGARSFVWSKVFSLNDDDRLPFPAIADEIEKHKAEWFETEGAVPCLI